jgi:glycosyltransferase involved in cell wall biosynthesis
MKKRRILFLGETYRADAITWMNGLKEYGDFEIVTWELKTSNQGFNRVKRIVELLETILTFKNTVKKCNAEMVIAERATSYGFLAAISGISPIAIAQQGSTDLWPENSITYLFKKILQNYAFKKAHLIHAWGNVMAANMKKHHTDMSKVMILPKGINTQQFSFSDNNAETKIKAIVTRSLQPEYKHEIILKAFKILHDKHIPFELIIVGDGILLQKLKHVSIELNLEKNIQFLGKIDNNDLPKLLQESNLYISMPITEGVSASLFEAMASGCFPIVTDIPGNSAWIKNKENGILVPSEDFNSLASEIEWAFKNRELRQKAIIENRKMVEENANYSINMKKIAQKYHELIDEKMSHEFHEFHEFH